VYYKIVTIVTYIRNYSNLYYKTTILANLVLASGVFTIVGYASNWSVPYNCELWL